MLPITVDNFIKKIDDSTIYEELKRNVSPTLGPKESFMAVSAMLAKIVAKNEKFGNVDLAFEYKVPNGGFCDLVIVGKKDGTPRVFIIEMKHWENNRVCKPYKNLSEVKQKGKIVYNGGIVSHPSKQVKEYVSGCTGTHSAFTDAEGIKPEVKGAVFFTNNMDEKSLETYRAAPNKKLTEEVPVFSNGNNGGEDLAKAISEFIAEPDHEFFQKFVHGTYKQSFDLKVRIEQSMRKIMSDGDFEKPFSLRETQEKAYGEMLTALRKVFEKDHDSEKKVFIIKGMPGSGKTAVGANLLIDALSMQLEKVCKSEHTEEKLSKLLSGSILFTSSSTNQKTWEKTFSECKSIFVGPEIFNPGFDSHNTNVIAEKFAAAGHKDWTELRPKTTDNDEQDEYVRMFKPEKWREVWEIVQSGKIEIGDQTENLPCEISENQFTLTIADEAHSLPNAWDEENKKPIKFTRKPGWQGIGPEAFFIMYTSRISVFLMEDDQGFQDYEATTVADIKRWAENDLGIKKENIVEFELKEQYRCGESQDYIKWVNSLLYKSQPSRANASSSPKYFKNKAGEKTFRLEVTDYPSDMEASVRKLMNDNHATGRLLSSYSVFWKSNSQIFGTKEIGSKAKQELPAERKDFHLPDKDGEYWSRVWNTKEEFVVPFANLEMLRDPLCEVGYPQEIRGWDFAYFGILWLDDLLWREGKWAIRCKIIDGKPRFRGSVPTDDTLKKKYPDENERINYLNTLWFGPILDRGIASIRKNAEEEIKEKIKKAKNLVKTGNNGEEEIKKAENLVKTGNDGTQYILQPDKDDAAPELQKLFVTMFRIYRILLTRALNGNVIYVKDPETRQHLRELLAE